MKATFLIILLCVYKSHQDPLGAITTPEKSSVVLNDGTLTPKIPEYYGQGYDIFTGNPLSDSVDPGFSAKQIFSFTYDASRVTHDGRFFYPHEVSITPSISCRREANAKMFTGMRGYHSTVKAAVTVTGGYDVGVASASFTASTAYQQMQDRVENQKRSAVTTQVKCELYEATLGNTQTLSKDFLESVVQVRSTGNFKGFIEDWGTHYASRIELGAAAVQYSFFTQESVQTLQAYGVDISAAVNAKYMGATGGINVSTNIGKTQSSLFDSAEKREGDAYIGQQPPATGDLTQWMSTIRESYPVPLAFTLKYIGDLFVTDFFGDRYSQQDLATLKNSFDEALKAMADSQPRRVPTSDPILPPVTLLEARTIMVGGDHGREFKDFIVQNITYTPIIFNYISGKNVDRLQLVVSDDGFNEISRGSYGTNGGKQEQIRLPPGRRVTRATMWSDDGVKGIQFMYDNGDTPPLLGRAKGEEFTVEIPGNLVGLYGRAGDKIEAIGFISLVPSYNPSIPLSVTYASPFYGGNGGITFQDQHGSPLDSIVIRSGDAVDAIAIPGYFLRGGSGGYYYTQDVRGLSRIYIWIKDDVVTGLQFDISSGRSQLHGKQKGTAQVFDVENGLNLVGIYGQSGKYLDRIGFIFSRSG